MVMIIFRNTPTVHATSNIMCEYQQKKVLNEKIDNCLSDPNGRTKTEHKHSLTLIKFRRVQLENIYISPSG